MLKMFKKILLLFPMIIAVLLSSCAFRDGKILTYEEEMADKRFKKILNAMIDKDREALKAEFSKVAIDNAEDFDGCVDYLFNFFQGEVLSWNADDGIPSDSAYEHGKMYTQIRAFYYVTTDSEQYTFFLLDYPVNTINPDMEGLYSLRVIKTEDEETEFTYWQDMKIPGIYKPSTEA